MCVSNRQGRACGKCVQNFSVYYHSPRFECKTNDNCNLGWLWFILSELVPITIVYVFVMLFNISFTSGMVNGFIFYAQVIDTFYVNANGFNGLNPAEDWIRLAHDAHLFIYNAFNLEFFGIESLSFCLWKGAGTLDILIMKYVATVYALFLVLITVLVFKRFQLCCKWASSDKSYIIHGLSAFLITCYVRCMRVSFRILLPTHLNGPRNEHSRYSIVFYSGHLDFFRDSHLFYAIPALVCTVFFVFLPPVALIVYPLYLKLLSMCGLAETKAVKCFSIPFEKAKPFFDSFQSCYKNNFRFVAGLFFVYRMTILIAYGLSVGYEVFYISIGIQLLVMTSLHFVMQPHQNHWHNVLDLLIFSNLSAINGLSLYRIGISYRQNPSAKSSIKVAGVIQLVLIFLPLLVALLYVLIKVVQRVKTIVIRYIPKQPSLRVDDFVDDDNHSSYYHRSIRLASFN